ncbi:uncharacterized protein LOC105700527 isoform X3 [Orussus abietinus]|uniref:uncharacterized protein LOC105700527 isoform X3 n=1 Tax=Orussus abietinus TaxID=222816 RepID=UPI000626D5F5|nr:uncharacterized protein LOC105700527 isoform X3 [Orussus abietinus]
MSYRSYGISGIGYRSAAVGLGTGGAASTYRNSGFVGSTSRPTSRDRSIGAGLTTYGSRLAKTERDRLAESRSTYRPSEVSSSRDSERSSSLGRRGSTDEISLDGSTSSSSRTPLLEKRSFRDPGNGKTSERSSSLLGRYSRGVSRDEKPSETESTARDRGSRFGSSTYPGSRPGRSFGSEERLERKDRQDSSIPRQRTTRAFSGKNSRDPSPEEDVKPSKWASSLGTYSRISSLANRNASLSTRDSSLTPSSSSSSRYGAPSSKFSGSYPSSQRFRASSGERALKEDDRNGKTTSTSDGPPGSRIKESPAKSSGNESRRVENDPEGNCGITMVTMVTRGTSPTPPTTTTYVRSGRTDAIKVVQKEVNGSRAKLETKDEEIQADRVEDAPKFPRYVNGAESNVGSTGGRTFPGTAWSSYRDKYSSPSSGNVGYSSRGYNSTSSRIGAFGFARPNESALGNHHEETANSGNSSQRTPPRDARSRSGSEGRPCVRQSLVSRSPDQRRPRGEDISPASSEGSRSRIRNQARTKTQSPEKPRANDTARESSCEQNSSQRTSSRSSSEGRPCARQIGSVSRSPDQRRPRAEEGTVTLPASRRTAVSNSEGRRSPTSEDDASRSKVESNVPSSRASSRPSSRSEAEDGTRSPGRIPNSSPASRRQSPGESPTGLRKPGSGTSRKTPTSEAEDSSRSLPPRQARSGEVATKSPSPAASLGTKIRTPTPSPTPPSPPSTSRRRRDGQGTLGCTRQGASPDAALGKPPVPRNDAAVNAKGLGPICKYVNKDFRKSVLNMESGAEVARAQKWTARRSASASSQDSEVGSEPAPSARSLGSRSGTSTSSSRPATASSRSAESPPCAEPRVATPVTSRLDASQKSSSASGRRRGPSTSPSRRPKSDDESSGTTSSSGEEDGEGIVADAEVANRSRGSPRRRRRRTSGSPVQGREGRSSDGSSRASLQASSADELPLTSDRPPRPPSSPRSRRERCRKTEEAKSFLARALAPVATLFKSRQQDLEESPKDAVIGSVSRGPSRNPSRGSSADGGEDGRRRVAPGARIDGNGWVDNGIRSSCEKTDRGWVDSESDCGPEAVGCNDDVSQDTTISAALPDDGKYKFRVWRQDSGEKAWWLEGGEDGSGADARSRDAEEERSRPDRTSASPSRRETMAGGLNEARTRIRHQQSGERAWWMSEDPDSVPEGVEVIPVARPSPKRTTPSPGTPGPEAEDRPRTLGVRRFDSGEKPWWLDSSSNVPDGVERIPVEESSRSDSASSESLERVDIERLGTSLAPPAEEPLGDRASPEGIENPPDPPDTDYRARESSYDDSRSSMKLPPRRPPPRKRPTNLPLFIGERRDIDDLLGEVKEPTRGPVTSRLFGKESSEESSECEEIDATQVIVHDGRARTPVIQRRIGDADGTRPDGYIPLDDTALQLYKDGDYGAYLDLEASISEQQEEFEGFQTNRKNSIVLRTQLSVRVHTIIEKLLNSEGRELRRALFSLKQIFQEDKDLVHEFVQNDGLACLIKVGSEADQNYQNYILRALGQVMLYVDGMNGVMEHGQTVQWLYTLIASRFRLVVKTALKLLLVFVEYVETNSLLLVRAVRSVDTSRGMIPWTNVMKLLKDYDAADTELLIYATTLVNKCLNGIPDQDTYYDQVDCLEEQGIEGIVQRYMSKQGTDLDLLRQFQIYEAVLHHEDGNDRGSPIRQLDDNIRKTLRNRKSLVDSHERRKSRRHSTGTSPLSMTLNARSSPRLNHSLGLSSLDSTMNSSLPDDDDESSSSQSSQGLDVQLNGSYKENKVDVGVTPALRRRRERAERQRSFIREQQEATASMRASVGNSDDQESPFPTNGLRYSNGSPYERGSESPSNRLARGTSRKDLTPLMNAANKLDSEEKKPRYGKSPDEGVECDEGNRTDEDEDRRVMLQLKREGTVKDLTQKLAAQNLIPSSPVEDKVSRIGDMSGLISKAKEGLAKSKSKADVLKSPTGDSLPKLAEAKKSENELHWEELAKRLKRPLALCDLDFTDLDSEDEVDVLSPVHVANGVPPPPPPMVPPMMGGRAPPPPPPGNRFPPPLPYGPQGFGAGLKAVKPPPSPFGDSPKNPSQPPKKSKKTVKLFWKEVRDDPIILSRLDKNKMIWDELSPVPVDTQKLEHLFESRAKDLITKQKQQEMNKNKEIIVLDHKRSNAINIGMTKLPPPRSIKTAILKMDATIMNREGIEKLLTMLPTEEERSRIQEAQAANPDLPLGSAEQFLLTLASISELPARLKLWAFKLDFENSEKEIADPLMDLKQGMETLRVNKTFRGILSTLLSIGIFLNGNEVKGFQLEYLAKVPEVKDTVHKHSLLHHLCHMVMEKFPDSTDLYSEIGAVTRASKVDFDELAANIGKLESECKASWDHLKLIAKHDGSTMMKVKMSDFLADCAERIIVLGIVHRRIINRFHKFVLWLGIPLHRLQDTKPNEFCRIISEFALEYRTTRERVIQQLEKKANHRERNKTRGKMITEVGKFRTKEDRADAELRQLLGSDISDVESIHGTLPWRRQRKDGRTALGPLLRDESVNGNLTDGDDELLESLVKTATKSPGTRTTPRERKRTRHADLRRTLKNGLSEEERKHIAAYIKGY